MAGSASLKIVALWVGRLLLGGTFAYAAVLKLTDPATFATDIGHYRLLPYPLTLAMAVYLPWLELICAIAILIRRCERGAQFLLLGLCVLFSLALASAWWRELDISCGCFGQAGAATDLPWAFARSTALGLVAFLLLRATPRQRGRPDGK